MTAAALWEPQFDACGSDQEQMALKFCLEIAGERGEKGSLPDPVRLLEMAEALYIAERDECRPADAADSFAAGWEAMRKTAKGAVLGLSLGEDVLLFIGEGFPAAWEALPAGARQTLRARIDAKVHAVAEQIGEVAP
jgi:hypothetical protein